MKFSHTVVAVVVGVLLAGALAKRFGKPCGCQE